MIINLIFTLFLTTAFCFTSTATLGSQGGYVIDATLEETSTDEYSFDLKFTFPSSILDSSNKLGMLWINTAKSDYTLTSDASSLETFGFEIRWPSLWVAIRSPDWAGYYSGTAAYTNSDGRFDTTGGTSLKSSLGRAITYDETTDPSAPSINFHYSSISKANLASVFKLPNKDETYYYKCFTDFNRGSLPSDMVMTNVATGLSTSTNTVTNVILL